MTTIFLLAGNGPHLNRGCEAILRGTVEILRNAFGEDCRFINAHWSNSKETGNQQEADPAIETIAISRPGSDRFSSRALAMLLKLRRPYRIMHPITWRLQCRLLGGSWHGHLGPHVDLAKAALSIGGDNYSLDYGGIQRYIGLDLFVRSRKKPIIIWGASIGPFMSAGSRIAKRIHRHLRDEVDAIFVREQVTREYLAEHGIVRNVYEMVDPAFVMKPQPVDSEKLGFELPTGAMALNLSPLMARWACDGDLEAWKRRCIDITRELMKEFNRPLVLLPHVTVPGKLNDDFQLLRFIYGDLTKEGMELYLLPSRLSAAELKWVISKCDCLIASRTHATIAGFSTAVPTVSLAYSIKASGINQGLFGHTDYVLDAAEISPKSLVDVTNRVFWDSKPIINRLKTVQKEYVKTAMHAGEVLRDVVLRD